MKRIIPKTKKIYKKYKVVYRSKPHYFANAFPKPIMGYKITPENKRAFLKQAKLWGRKAHEPKPLCYKGIYTEPPVECTVIGYAHPKNTLNCTLIIKVKEKKIVILSRYFREMQSKNFDINEVIGGSDDGMDY